MGNFQCARGTSFDSNFCPNCGAAAKREITFHCERCGYEGPMRNFCPNCGIPTSQLKSDDSEKTTDPAPEPTAGWKCAKCGAGNQIGDKCLKCGADIVKEPLFALTEYETCMPPRQSSLRVYKVDDKRLLVENEDQYYFISADVFKPAMEIIRKYEIDNWEQYNSTFIGCMGGSRSVSYFDGEKLAGTSTDHLMNAGLAYGELMMLFTAKENRIE
ncbi:MAG: hypothetical protein IKM96_04230 [Clostridiales bacterium]|nr:hypothetical protein [Clostridiales bacterium]